jgi:5-(carboxyamino)imidazole ribonucleotide synthase
MSKSTKKAVKSKTAVSSVSAGTRSTNLRVGLLGGGQLARMLALEGHRLGLTVHILSQNPQDPAAQVVRHHHAGDPDRGDALAAFLAQVDVATFESEFLDAGKLAQAARLPGAARIYPEPEIMGVIQDRLSQKEMLVKHKIPTLEFAAIDTLPVAKMFLEKHVKTGIVLKQRRFGYDGYGTFHIREARELEKLWPRWGAKQANLIGEPRCRFRRELAITLVRGRDGRVLEYPLVIRAAFGSRGPSAMPRPRRCGRN